jgi:hypothetical protein
MNKLKVSIFLMFALALGRCTEETGNFERPVTRSFTSISVDQSLRDAKSSIDNFLLQAKTKNDFSDQVNWGRAYKFENPQLNVTAYSLPILQQTNQYFDNLVIVRKGAEQSFFVLRHKPSRDWLEKDSNSRKVSAFSGDIELLDLEGKVIGKGSTKGKSKSDQNGKSAGCIAWITVEWTEVTIGGSTKITEINFSEVIICNSPGAGGGTEGNPLGGVFGGGTGGDLGIGVPDPVDVSYFLRPAREGDDVSNPYDGMIAVDRNGVTFTYNSELKVWLMPDVVILAQNGFNLRVNFQNFQNKILSTVTTIALVEPTPVGEAILGALVLTIFVYDMSSIDTRKSTLDYCTRKFISCTGKYAYMRFPCATCNQYCNVHGEWDYLNCPMNE